MTNIEWRVCFGHPDYEVSSDGQLRRLTSCRRYRAGYVQTPGRHPRGYLTYSLGKTKRELAHRLVALTFLGLPPSPLHEVAHNDGTRTNNRVENLRWALPVENQADRKKHGTWLAGERTPAARLTAEAVTAIRRRVADGERQSVVGRSLGVSDAQVSRIVHGKQWRDLVA